MEPIDVIILIAAVSVVGGVIAWAIKRKKQGKSLCLDCSSCSGSCSSCSGNCSACQGSCSACGVSKLKTVENE